jgi:LacI family transcriptional regulator
MCGGGAPAAKIAEQFFSFFSWGRCGGVPRRGGSGSPKGWSEGETSPVLLKADVYGFMLIKFSGWRQCVYSALPAHVDTKAAFFYYSYMPTMKEMAVIAGVSIATISNVIRGKRNKVSPEEYERINGLLTDHHYVEKMGLRHLNNERSRIICLAVNRSDMYDGIPIFVDPFYSQVFGVIEEILHEKEYYLMTYASLDIDSIFRTAAAWNVDGIIALSFHSRDCDRLVELTGKPLVAIDARGKVSDHFIHIDSRNKEGGYQMTKYLISRGYRDISILANNNIGVDHERFLGYTKALKEALLPLDKERHVILSKVKAERILQYERLIERIRTGGAAAPAAFFLADRYAMEYLALLKRRGIKVPKHTAVAGYDDILLYADISSPGLTTIRQNISQRAAAAVDALFRLLDGDPVVERNICLPVELVIRESA